MTDSVSETLKLLEATKRNAFPVVDGEGALAGVVSRGDLLSALAGNNTSPATLRGPVC